MYLVDEKYIPTTLCIAELKSKQAKVILNMEPMPNEEAVMMLERQMNTSGRGGEIQEHLLQQ